MKKLLLILALLAYAAVSCDKPETTSVDEPETIDTSADTCRISLSTGGDVWIPVTMLYNTPASDIDFEASINSILKHFTITLKDGSLDTAIHSNVSKGDFFPSDSGSIMSLYNSFFEKDSLKYGHYTIVMWSLFGGTTWGPNHSANLHVLYHCIKLNELQTSEYIFLDKDFTNLLESSTPLIFTEF